jgi:hypothetical protein
VQRLQQSHSWHAILVDHQRLLASALVSISDSCLLHQSRYESRIVLAWCASVGTARRFFLYMASRTLVFTLNTIFPLSSPPHINSDSIFSVFIWLTVIVVHIGLGNGFSAYEFEPATVIVTHSYRIPCKPLIPVNIIYFDSFWTAEFHFYSFTMDISFRFNSIADSSDSSRCFIRFS